VAYDLPGTVNARVLWGTGRGNYQRTGSILRGSLYSSTKRAAPTALQAGETLTYTVTLHNPGLDLTNVHVTDTLPAEIASVASLWASSGSYGESGGVITWTGGVSTGSPVTIRYSVTLDPAIVEPRAVVNQAWIDDGAGEAIHRQATVIVNGYSSYLPVVFLGR